MKGIADIIEIGTPVLKRFGISAITTARELCPDVLVLADTKTVDGGQLEADMVFGAGAAFMTVLSCASTATHQLVGASAKAFGATVVVSTINGIRQNPTASWRRDISGQLLLCRGPFSVRLTQNGRQVDIPHRRRQTDA